MTLPLRVHAATHEGLVHDKNEDAFDVLNTEEGGMLLMVCDGMGGMGHGDEASAIAVDALADYMKVGAGFPPERLRQAIRRADVRIRDELCSGTRGFPGSTAVLVYVVDGMGHVAWVGARRAYLIRAGPVVERTRDHKLVDELVQAGQLSEEEAKISSLAHVVTRALGGRSNTEKPISGSTLGHPWKFLHGDAFVICSDGVCDLISDEELPGLLEGAEPSEATRNIVQLALERGGHDNITVIVAMWDGPDFSEEDAATPMFEQRERVPDDDVRILGGAGISPPLPDDTMEAPRVTEELQVEDIPPEPRRASNKHPSDKETPLANDLDPHPPHTPHSSRPGEQEEPLWMVPVSIILFLLIAVGVGIAILGG